MAEYRELLNREFNLLQSKATLSVALGFWQDSQKLQSFMSHTLSSQEKYIGIFTQCNRSSCFGCFICKKTPHTCVCTCVALAQPPRRMEHHRDLNLYLQEVQVFRTYVSTIKPFPLADYSGIKMQLMLGKLGKFPNQISLFREACSVLFGNAEATVLFYLGPLTFVMYSIFSFILNSVT